MKKLIALLLVLVMPLTFAACGSDEETPNSGNDDAPAAITGETYNAGKVSALVPTGWKAFPVMDMWSDDPNANDPDQMNIVKGGETDFDILTKPYIQIVHYEPESMMVPSKDFYDGAQDVAPITAGSLTWEGFSAKDFLDNSLIILWTTNAAGHQFQLNIFNETDAGKFELTDADVLAILESVANS